MRCARVILVIFIVFSDIVVCKRFETRCKLVRELMKVGMPKDVFLGNWVCLIEQVSNRDTKAFYVTPGGKKLYGLYQIPDRWCREGKRGGDCNVKCESLLDDDIRDDTECAMIIFHREGFKYWNLWSIRCKNNVEFITREIYTCPELEYYRSYSNRRIGQLRYRRDVESKPLQSTLYSYYGIHWIQ